MGEVGRGTGRGETCLRGCLRDDGGLFGRLHRDAGELAGDEGVESLWGVLSSMSGEVSREFVLAIPRREHAMLG